MDELDRVIEEGGAAIAVAPARSTVPVANIIAAVVPLRLTILNALAALPGIDVGRATPEQREELLVLYDELLKVAGPVKTVTTTIETAFKRAAVEAGANMVGLTGKRVAKLTAPRIEYQTKEQDLYNALMELTKKVAIPPDMIADAIHREVAFVVNHAKLNYLHSHFGDDVAAAIDKYRTRPPVSPMSGKITLPKPA